MTVRRLICAVLVAALLGPATAGAAAPRPTALLWAGRYFVERTAFAQWLEARHGNFDNWALRHPDALRILTAATAVPSPLTSLGGRTTAVPTAAAAPASGNLVAHSTAGASTTSGLELALAAVGLLLLTLSVAPAQVLAAGRFRWAQGLARQRWLLGGAAASILVTLLLAHSLG
jgi:hypothetical protein